ncbi:hypothetical protein HYS31_06155 [Candidatus Woesearchaeota archaeon]|nr:hypothetical protein [Candidatus Woesearchaeota archaeon]
MFWKKDYVAEKKFDQMNDLLKKSFANVKRDTGSIFQWLNYFYGKTMEQEQAIKRLQLELSYTPKTREDIRRIIDEYYSFEGIIRKINEMNAKIDEIAAKNAKIEPAQQPKIDLTHGEIRSNGLSAIEERLERLEQKKMSIKEKIMRRLTRNSKEYVKSVILSCIKKYGKVSALQLREMIVDEQNFCSKSSFYRLLEELEGLDEVGVVRLGKEKSYIYKAIKHL